MTKEKELIATAKQLANIPANKHPLKQLKELLKDVDDETASRVIAFFYLELEMVLDGREPNLIDKARILINTYPLPDDAEKQLDKLYKQAKTQLEKHQLESFYSTLMKITGSIKD